jgi:hypothetical protein
VIIAHAHKRLYAGSLLRLHDVGYLCVHHLLWHPVRYCAAPRFPSLSDFAGLPS